MSTGIKNIKQTSSVLFSLKAEGKALSEVFFARMLGYGKAVMLVFDLFLLTTCLYLSGMIVKGADWTLSESYISGVIFFNLLWVFLSYLRGIHKNLLLLDALDIFRVLSKVFFVFISCSLFFILILLDGFANITVFFYFIILFYLLFGGSLVGNRIVLLSIRKRYKDKMRKKKNVFIIGDSSSCELLESYMEENQCDLRLRGCFNNVAANMNEGSHEEKADAYRYRHAVNGRVRGSVADCVKYFGVMEIDEIYCSLQSIDMDTVRFLIKEADRHLIRIKFLPDFYQIFRRRSTINYLGTVPVISIREEPLTIDKNLIIKRIFDFCFSLFVLVFILSWITPIIGLLIKWESRGPVFFKQMRSGINNKPFWVYKFRSMKKVSGIAEDCQAMKDDVRLTRVGAFLRRSSLDELPQFINVLLGNMSVVGPRPHMLSHTDKFSKEVDTFMVRHFTKQGITGWAQVNGCRGETSTLAAVEERVQLDVWYIENWSLMLDFKIIFLTMWNIIGGDQKAY